HWIGFPAPEREVDIVTARIPGVRNAMAARVVAAVNRLRDMDLAKPPGVAETIDWVTALDAIGAETLDEECAADTLGAVVKDRDDLELVAGSLGRVVGDV
ncbi:MAG: MoxR family ATPase, partial [Ilumatobacteraceae bacterium]